MFKDNLDEFNDSREVRGSLFDILETRKYPFQVVQQLMDEYRAATTKDYVNFGNLQPGQVRKITFNPFLIIDSLSSRVNKHRSFNQIIST